MLALQIFAKKAGLASLELDVDKFDNDKFDNDKLENVSSSLNSLKTKVDKLDIDKLIPVPIDLCKLSDVVNTDVVKKTEYDELVKKVNDIQILVI